jgi:hypothetical protein
MYLPERWSFKGLDKWKSVVWWMLSSAIDFVSLIGIWNKPFHKLVFMSWSVGWSGAQSGFSWTVCYRRSSKMKQTAVSGLVTSSAWTDELAFLHLKDW